MIHSLSNVSKIKHFRPEKPIQDKHEAWMKALAHEQTEMNESLMEKTMKH